MDNSNTDSTSQGASRERSQRLVYLCDWLPPDFGAVGQYSLLFARELAASGQDVTLVGLSSVADSDVSEDIGTGRLRQIRLKTSTYDKAALARRMVWTLATNTRLLARAWKVLRTADVVLFTGSPPYLLHWIAPLNLLLRKTLVYRITDFHPECLIAQRGSAGLLLGAILKLTLFWRRRVDRFEALGQDQIARLQEIGIRRDQIVLKPDPSPVTVDPHATPLARPPGSDGRVLLLYSGNWGVAHDHATFVEAYAHHHRTGSGRVLLWLNAVGSKVPIIKRELEEKGLPFVEGKPVPMDQLSALLVTPDAHLITLSDAFVGYVLPSKVHGCVASGRPLLFIGSEKSDVHSLACGPLGPRYQRVDAGDVRACTAALEALGSLTAGARPDLADGVAQAQSG